MDEHGNLFRYSANVFRSPVSRVGPMSYDVFLITHALDSQSREQGAYQNNGAVSMAAVAPAPFCGGGGGGGGDGDPPPSRVCHREVPPPAGCEGGAALCFACGNKAQSTVPTDTCHKVCDGWLGNKIIQPPHCDVCTSPDYSCSASFSEDDPMTCNSRVI
jgi:hypothetical protein